MQNRFSFTFKAYDGTSKVKKIDRKSKKFKIKSGSFEPLFSSFLGFAQTKAIYTFFHFLLFRSAQIYAQIYVEAGPKRRRLDAELVILVASAYIGTVGAKIADSKKQKN